MGTRIDARVATLDPGNAKYRRGIDEHKHAQGPVAVAAAIVENSPVIVGRWRFPAAGVGAGLPMLQYISANVAQFGYSAEDILSGKVDFFRDIVHPDDGEWALKPMIEAAHRGQPGASAEFRIVRKEGAERWVEGHMRFEQDTAGAIVAGQGVLRDVTEVKQSENELREAQAALAEAQAVAHLGSWQFNLRDRSVIWSDECYRIFGVDRATFVPTFEAFLARVHPDDREALLQAHNQSVVDHAPRTLHQQIALDDGTVRVTEKKWQNYYDAGGTPLRTTSTIQDITERTRAEAAQALLAAIVESSRDAIVGSALDGTMTSWNAAAEKIYGYGAREAIGRSVHLIIPEERRTGVDRVLAAVVRGERASPFEGEHVTKDGARIAVSVVVSPVRDPAGKVVGVSAITRDISEQKRIVAALAYRDHLMHAVAVGTTALIQAEAPQQGIEKAMQIVGESMAVDRVLVIKYSADEMPSVTLRYLWQAPDIAVPFDAAVFGTLALDPAAERVLGYSADEAVGKQIHKWLAPSRFRDKATEGMKDFAKTGRGAVLGKTVELAALRKDGAEIAVELSAAAVELDGEWQAIGILRDITERKRTEQKILDMARTDGLTGLANRTAFVDVLLQEIRAAGSASRYSISISIISRTSTIRSAIRSVIFCCRRWPSGFEPAFARSTCWRASAATNSP